MTEISHVPAEKNSYWHSVSQSRGDFIKLQIALNLFSNFKDTSGLEVKPFHSLMQKNMDKHLHQKVQNTLEALSLLYLSYSPSILMSD